MNPKNVFLFIETPFNLTFKHEGVADQDANSGNKRVSSNGSRTFELMSTSALAEQIKGNEDVDAGLRSCFRNVLGNRDEMSIHANTEVSWNLAFVSETSARVKFSVGGRFFEKFLTECQDSIKLKLMMGVTYGQHSPSFSIESFESHGRTVYFRDSEEMGNDKEMRPSCSTGTGCYFFEDEINVEVKQRFPMLRPVTIGRGRMTMLMVICRDVVLEDLPFKFAVMGQTILEDKIQSDFQIVADDDTRFGCNKVFLAYTSKAWAGMLQMDCKESNEKSIKLEMSAKGVEALLKFIYYSNVDDPMSSCSVALELLKGGHQYDILGLEKAMREIFLGQKYAWFDIDNALMLYFWTLKVDGNQDLKWKALRVIKSKGNDLEGSTMFEKLLKEDTKTATKLIAQCFNI